MPKKTFEKNVFDEIWPKLCLAPIEQISAGTQEEIRDFDFEKATDLDVYVFCSELASRAFYAHEISSFVRVLLDVASYYERPVE